MDEDKLKQKTAQEISEYQQTKSSYIDYTRFEGNASFRKGERDAFIEVKKYTPDYDYPSLYEAAFDEATIQKKTKTQEAVMEIEAAKLNPEYNPQELELYAGFHENRLKKIMLVEAARNIIDPMYGANSETNRRAFAELNESIYGKFNEQYYLGIMDTEKRNLDIFQPNGHLAGKIKSELSGYLGRIDTNSEKEVEILSADELIQLHDYVTDKYSHILEVVPDTEDDIIYGVDDCARIMNDALEAGGLSQFGWKAVENPSKTGVSTSGSSKSIFLPSNTKRNASELKRLIIHEQEVHARRSQNGELTGINILKGGTANYADAEEGLAVILECAVSGEIKNQSFDRARNRYIAAGLALGADGKPRDARETYEILWRMLAVQSSEEGEITETVADKAKDTAYTHIENAYRGTQFWMKGVIYTKLKIYYEGLVANAEMFKANIDNLDDVFEKAFIGKYNHIDPVETELVLNVVNSNDAKHIEL